MKMAKNGNPIRLFIFIHDLAPFGAQRVALNTVRHLDKNIFRVTVCSFGVDGTLAGEFRDCGAEVIQLGAMRYLVPGAWLRLVFLILKSGPDIVQTNMPELSLPVRLLALFLPGTRVIHTVQNPFSSAPWYWRCLNICTLWLCDRVIFCSQSLKDGTGLNSRFLRSRCYVVQNGIEIGAVPPVPGLRAELGIGDGEKVICCVARLARQKGQDILIRAIAELAGQKRSVRLLLAGDGEDAESLKALAGELGVSGKVAFLGRRSDISRILSASDIYAAPSRWEGLGLSLGEAMLAGIPCVGTDIDGHVDILKDGITGVAVPLEDASALAAGIIHLLDNPAEARKLAAAAGEFIRAGFTVEGMAKKYEKIYLDLAGDSRK